MSRATPIFAMLALALAMPPLQASSVVNSAHNLSPSGPGAVRAAEEAGVCEFCHTPHMGSPKAALWNRRDPGTTYTPYTSSTAVATPGQPTGSSLLCLSCHDGTVALGDVLNRRAPISMAGAGNTMPPGRGRTGTDLRHHHPISFVYDSSLAGRKGELAMPSSLPREIHLDRAGQMQCTSCHDPHDDSLGDFLVMPNQNSRLCRECHRKEGWSTSEHGQSGATWNGQGRNPWPESKERSVSGNACRNCHETHQTFGGRVLLRNASEEENCGACHNGNVAGKDVMAGFNQFSSHPVTSTALDHDAAESAIATDRHVACSDCHDPHRKPGIGQGNGKGQPRRLERITGVDLNRSPVSQSSRDYQVCLRCHGDSPGKKTPKVRRQLDQGNVRLEIQPGNPSFHPIASPGRNQDVPSLISPWTPQSSMGCIDCHNSNSAASVGGIGPEGPHGSIFDPILSMNYVTTDNTPESPTNYALCYSCHSRDSILRNESFAGHDMHIRAEQTPCSVCHDPHGVSSIQGNSMNNTHLINFDTTVVRSNSQGQLRFMDNGRYRGSCDLSCHGYDHIDENY